MQPVIRHILLASGSAVNAARGLTIKSESVPDVGHATDD
jgi:hypothetical protein